MRPTTTARLLGTTLLTLVACAVPACREEPPAPPPVIEAPPSEPPLTETAHPLEKRQTMAGLIDRTGLTDADAQELRNALFAAVDPRKVRPGETLRLWRDASGALVRAAWERSDAEAWDVARTDGQLAAIRRPYDVEEVEAHVSVRIDSSLWAAFEAAGEDPALAMMASEILAYEMDFYRDVRSGDQMDLVVKKTTHAGRTVRYGEILAVRYRGGAGTKTFFRHTSAGGAVAYYDLEGRSTKRAFLKQPLPLVRITSGFGGRRHPVLGFWKAHQGIDYGAPVGTPVWAVGDGVVQWAGPKGPNGNLVSIRHANGYVSHYAHLSKIGSGVRRGARISQKQEVGRVGATGRVTGPHLHFAMAKGGAFINPLSLKFPSAEALSRSARATFDGEAARLQLLLDGGTLVASQLR
jgi:murein DD-endopeptidase MepM/ murein hydrolase activator NlpD